MLPLETGHDPYERTRLDYHATVRELPSNERPRERLQHFGPQALSTAELLAIVLRTAEVFRPAIIRNCPGLILCHNHPSGDPAPSPEDIQTTLRLVEAGRILDIELVDHLIIGHQRFVSLKEHLKWE